MSLTRLGLRHHGLTKIVAATIVAFGGLIATAASPAVAASGSNDSVSVSGHGSVKATPDTLIADLDAHAKRASASDALSAAGDVAASVINALEANGVASNDIQTSGVSVGASYGKHGKVTGYRADENITARMHPLNTAGQALDAASTAGGNSLEIRDASLTVSNKAKYEALARSKAFASAKSAAEQYAELASRQLGRVEQITTTSHSSFTPHSVTLPDTSEAAGAVSAPSKAIPVNPGQQSISTSVRVVWALQ
ncbi:MAG TPA: SIMPL domain-containing protein [Mycobacteriales bacterium]|nr:SIMPL domain-containing protein [Mycobacteriales bacterium]